MGRIALALALVLMGWCGPAQAESFEAGLRAFRAGEPDRARDIWLPLAEAGDAAAQYSLGKLFEHGEGPVGQDLVKAAQWYRTAAAQGLPAAQNNLGLMYAQGRGVPSDLTRAIEIWRAAAQQNYPWAQYNLGLAFFRGQGVAVDQGEAAIWFRQAADGGLAEAQFIMGQLRREGLGLEKDEGRALTWYRRAAEQGHPRARKHAELLKAAGFEATPPEMPEATARDITAGQENRASTKSPEGGSATEQPRATTQTVPQKLSKAKAGSAAKATSPTESATQARSELQVPGTGPETKAEVKGALKTGTKPKVAAEPRAQAKAVTQPKPKAAPEPKPKAAAEPRPQAKAVPETKAKAKAAAEPRPRTSKAEARPVVAAEPSVAVEPSATPRAAPKPEAPAASEPAATQTAAKKRDGEGPADPKTKGAFRIWLASARNKATATKLWRAVRDRHPEVFAEIEVTFAEVTLGDRTLVRVLAGPLASAQSAEGLCERLRGAEPDAFCKVRSD
ncbi:MAG: SPOR domain-containing protein [Rhodospirillales bacterium]|nr:SPOR domain-containing protein [Rhodospirillales bacterium]MDH3911082.1 SPOR domain-containing protein [Rhodospirillales bacterium]MDH3966597.1 SPOR domain-containing protein [Rhodospirillales bacterium]